MSFESQAEVNQFSAGMHDDTLIDEWVWVDQAVQSHEPWLSVEMEHSNLPFYIMKQLVLRFLECPRRLAKRACCCSYCRTVLALESVSQSSFVLCGCRMVPLSTFSVDVDAQAPLRYAFDGTATIIGTGVCSAAAGLVAGAALPISVSALTGYAICVALPCSLAASGLLGFGWILLDLDPSETEVFLSFASAATAGAALLFVPIVHFCDERLNFTEPIGNSVRLPINLVQNLWRWYQSRKREKYERIHTALSSSAESSFGRVEIISEVPLDE